MPIYIGALVLSGLLFSHRAGKVKDWSIYPDPSDWAVLKAGGKKDHDASGYKVFFPIEKNF